MVCYGRMESEDGSIIGEGVFMIAICSPLRRLHARQPDGIIDRGSTATACSLRRAANVAALVDE
jgi:hypothetical protein